MRPDNSLFRDSNSLIEKTISLFGRTGYLPKKRSDCSIVCRLYTAKNAVSGGNSLLIPCITGNLNGDRFASDWLHHHPASRFALRATQDAFRSLGEGGLLRPSDLGPSIVLAGFAGMRIASAYRATTSISTAAPSGRAAT
jgi:hypothetical protein